MIPTMLDTHDPRTAQPVASYACSSSEQIHAVCRHAREVWRLHWRDLTAAARATALASVATALREHADRFALAEAADTGKTIAGARDEVLGAAALWDYAAALARVAHGETLNTSLSRGLALTLREPVGVVGLIVPWNYPLITTSERLPFALAAGCSVVIKPSELAVGSVALLVQLLADNPLFPAGTVQLVFGRGKEAGEALVTAPDVDMIAFVGSSATGRIIESLATAHGKRVSAELGGNNFVLVYPDADIEAAASAAVAGAFRNGGQACIAGTHVLVDPAVADAFAAALSAQLAARYGTSDGPVLQPMITLQHKQRVQALIDSALAEGAQWLPGSRSGLPGQFLGPVVLDHLPPDSVLRQQEIFGPVLTLSRVTCDQFMPLLADNQYGLALYVWTGATATAMQVVREARVGRIWVNSDPEAWLPELPVGGFAASGSGREGGLHALETYALRKSVLIN